MSKAPLYVSAGTPQHLAIQALVARLFHPHGGLRFQLEEIADGYHPGATVAVLSDEAQKLHGVCVISNEHQISIYVRPEVRGQGWGQKLVQIALVTRPTTAQPVFALPSDDTPKALRFWERCKVEVRDHGLPPILNNEEMEEYSLKGRTLVCRNHNDVTMDVFEALYIQQLYGDEYSELHDGIRGKLACVFEERVAPFDQILYHYGENYESCGIITERNHDINGNTTRIVELQLYVKEAHRRQGLGQQIIDKAKALYPGRTLFGYHTDSSHRLLTRNGVLDLRRDP